MSDFFWQGLVHPLLMPAHLIVLIALGLLAGQQGGQQLKGVLPVFMATVFGGVGLTLLQAWRLDFESWLLVLALIMGVLIILRLQLSVWLLVVLAIPAALLVGLDLPHRVFPVCAVLRYMLCWRAAHFLPAWWS